MTWRTAILSHISYLQPRIIDHTILPISRKHTFCPIPFPVVPGCHSESELQRPRWNSTGFPNGPVTSTHEGPIGRISLCSYIDRDNFSFSTLIQELYCQIMWLLARFFDSNGQVLVFIFTRNPVTQLYSWSDNLNRNSLNKCPPTFTKSNHIGQLMSVQWESSKTWHGPVLLVLDQLTLFYMVGITKPLH